MRTKLSVATSALNRLMVLAGREWPDFVTIENNAPVFKTRFHADQAAAAAIAAGGAIAADIWCLRTGQDQSVTVSTREAGAALAGFLHQKFDDPEVAQEIRREVNSRRTAADGFHKTRDNREIYLHPGFPESTKRLLRVLGCADEPDAVRAAVARWNGIELENAATVAGACAGLARTPEEWDHGEQGRIIAALPVVEVIKIGDSKPEPFRKGGYVPLSDVRVLDVTRVLAGPTCARTLAQYGAETMVISSPNLPSFLFCVTDTGQGKLAAFADLKTPGGRRSLQDLVRGSDVFVQSYRQGALERHGFGPIALAGLRPGIIYTTINCYGHEGPWQARPGWEQLAQTVTGMAAIHGGDDGPKLQPAPVTDYLTGLLAAFGTLVALHRRARYGGSYLVRASLSQTAMWLRELGVASKEQLVDSSELSEDEIRAFRVHSDTGFGGMTHLRPPVRMSETPARWKRGVVRLGTHEPVWPAFA